MLEGAGGGRADPCPQATPGLRGPRAQPSAGPMVLVKGQLDSCIRLAWSTEAWLAGAPHPPRGFTTPLGRQDAGLGHGSQRALCPGKENTQGRTHRGHVTNTERGAHGRRRRDGGY